MMKLVCAGMATVAVSAVGATALVPTMHPLTSDVLQVAAIDESNITIGFADSDLYFQTPAQIDQQLDQMQALGVNDVRILVPWAGIEPFEGYYDWSTVDYMVNAADARGMGVLGVLNSTPYWAVDPGVPWISGRPSSPAAYGDFAGLVAQRYAGKVGAYEIWNEPNGMAAYAPKPDPAGYTDLLKSAYPAIKSADPDAVVIGGVTGAGIDFGDYAMNPVSFVQGIYAAGGEQYFDALSYHPYQYTTPFSQGGYLPDSPINQVAAMRDLMVANGDADKLIWASEYGEPSSVAGDANQAAYLQDMLTTWRTLDYAGPSFVYTVQDRNTGSTDTEDTFGVIRSDGTLKPAAYVIQQLASSSATTPALARQALAMPESAQAAPADLAALSKLAAPETTTTTTAAAEPRTPMEAVMQVAADSLAAAGQVVAATLQQANAMMTAAVPHPDTAAVPASSPASIPATQLDRSRSINLDDPTPRVPKASRAETDPVAKPVADLPEKTVPEKAVPEETVPEKTVPEEPAADSPAEQPAADDTPKSAKDSPKHSTASPKRTTESPKRSDRQHRSEGDRQKPRHAKNG